MRGPLNVAPASSFSPKKAATSSPKSTEVISSELIGKWKFPHRQFAFEKLVTLKNTNVTGNTYYDNYLSWQGEARERLLLCHPAVGEWLKQNQHLKMITHTVYHRFIAESFFGDEVRIEAVAGDIKKCSFVMCFEYFNVRTKTKLGEGWQRICFFDLHAGKPCLIPQLILDLIEPIFEKKIHSKSTNRQMAGQAS
jgi:acyl-CoA thioesterase FadM